MHKRVIAVLLIFSLISTSFAAPLAFAQDNDREEYNAGFQAGREDGTKDVSYLKIAWGALFGPLAVLYNLIIKPVIPDDRLLRIADQSEDYAAGYLSGYRAGFKQQAVMYNVIGWASWLLYVVIADQLEQNTSASFDYQYGS